MPGAPKWGIFRPAGGVAAGFVGLGELSTGVEERGMSIILQSDAQAELTAHPALVGWMLRHARVIGHRRWGMLMLYYQAGLSQRQIARVFEVRRQAVSYELRRAFHLAAKHFAKRSKASPGSFDSG
jgi:hypothetical protein